MNRRKKLLRAENINKTFGFGKKRFFAVEHVNLDLHEGEIISIVGESGSGKTTLAKILLGLCTETSGQVLFQGKPRLLKNFRQRKEYWKYIQAIFQDPFSSFNQFHRVEKLLEDSIRLEGISLSGEEIVERMRNACTFVNLKFEELNHKYPFELSGGQMQRLMIARIFMMNPKILIADEPTSMIDACSRSTILDMLLKLRDENGLTILFITHDLGLAYYVSDTICIMEKGKIIERGTADEVILNPQSDYTIQLLSDVPKLHEDWDLTAGGGIR